MREYGYYLNLFKVTPADLDEVMSVLMSSGAGYGDLYFENTVYRDILLRDSEVSSGGFHIDYGVGMRALDGERTGYSYCETTIKPDMLKAARAAAAVCGKIPVFKPEGMKEIRSGNDFYPAVSDWDAFSTEDMVSTLKALEAEIRRKDSRVLKVIARISSSDSDVMMYNSLGELACDSRPMGSISASIIFGNGKVTENRSASRSYRAGSGMLRGGIVTELAAELISGIDASLEAGRPKGGRMPVVMGAGASGILLHEAMGHAFEADFNRKGQSIFSGRMGGKVCAKGISIVDDATVEGNRGSCNFDDEGVAGRKTYMVEDGILTSYLHDRISAMHYGVSPTGNGRRESFRFNPIPRMRLTYMESGNAGADGITASVKKGLFVNEFSNGQVKIGEGDFTFYVKSGFLIENGRLTKPVKDINVIGNGPRALADITAVGNDLKIDNGTWTCGKEQSVPVGCGMPTVLVRELTVGGDE